MIGLLGGTFDPIHYGHLRPALELSEALGLAQLRFIPNGVPPHRDPAHASAAQRREMVRRAIAGQRGFVLDDRELQRPGPSYSVDTLRELRAEQGQVPLCLLLGMDAFLGLHHWHQWELLPQLAHLVVAHRPGWSLDADAIPASLGLLLDRRRVKDPAALAAAPAGGVFLQPVTPLAISSTAIRALFATGRSARWLLPDTVIEYILEKDIYGQSADGRR